MNDSRRSSYKGNANQLKDAVRNNFPRKQVIKCLAIYIRMQQRPCYNYILLSEWHCFLYDTTFDRQQ